MACVFWFSAQHACDVPFVVGGVWEDCFAAVALGGGFHAGFFYDVEAVVQGVLVAEGEQVRKGGAA